MKNKPLLLMSFYCLFLLQNKGTKKETTLLVKIVAMDD